MNSSKIVGDLEGEVEKLPLGVLDVVDEVVGGLLGRDHDLGAVVAPGGEHHVALLLVEGLQARRDFRGLEDWRRREYKVSHLEVAGHFGDDGAEADEVSGVIDDDVGGDLVLVDVHVGVVVDEQVGSPDASGGNVKNADASVVFWIPAEEFVVPVLLGPAVDGEDLVDLVHLEYLLEPKMHGDVHALAVVADGAEVGVVVAEEVGVETLRHTLRPNASASRSRLRLRQNPHLALAPRLAFQASVAPLASHQAPRQSHHYSQHCLKSNSTSLPGMWRRL